MTIVLPDWQTITNGDLSAEVFDRFGTVITYSTSTPEELPGRIADADMVICNKTVLSAAVLAQAPHLRYIGLFATGYNNIDISYAREHGITVCNAGSYSTRAVAQQVFAYILHWFSRVADYGAFVSGGGWKTSPTFSPFVFPTFELQGKTLGIVGYGSIGREVASLARAFHMTVLVHSRTVRDDPEVTFVSLDELAAKSDIITAHCPLTPDTTGLFNRAFFARCREGAYFINTARGGVIDENALRDTLETGHLAGAAVDVLNTEPMAEDCYLFGTPRLLFTPHIAWAPWETRVRLLGIVTDNIAAYLDGHPVHVVS